MAAVYDSAAIYIESADTLQEMIVRIDQIIAALLSAALKAATTGNIDEYSLDDGQTKIRTKYKGADQIYVAIANFRKLRQVYVNGINGRVFRLVDSSNFNGQRF